GASGSDPPPEEQGASGAAGPDHRSGSSACSSPPTPDIAADFSSWLRARITVPEEDVARIGFAVAAPQHVEVVAGRHPTCWGVDARNWIRATASERAIWRRAGRPRSRECGCTPSDARGAYAPTAPGDCGTPMVAGDVRMG